jgi:ABC-2 type transport system permease protein
MKRPTSPGFVLVAIRELRWIVKDRVALFLMIGVPLIAFAILGLTFSSAVIRGLNTVVVDADHTASSQVLVETIDAAPGISLSRRANDLAAAMAMIRSGQAIAAVYIPVKFEQDLLAGRRPQVSLFYNTQFLTPGNAAAKALTDAINGGIKAVAPKLPDLPATIGSLVVEQYVLTNPAFNYVQFLLRAILPMVLHVVVAISTCYAVGSEFSRRGVRAWLRCAGGRPMIALAGKLVPLFAIFILQMVVELLIIHAAYRIPFRGDAVMMAISACLMIGAYQGLAALLVLLVRNLALGLSLTGIMVSPAFGYAGVGFPIIGMLPFAQHWGMILPLRWYMQILFDQAARGAPVATSAPAFVWLGSLALFYLGLAWWRMHVVSGRLARTQRGKTVTSSHQDQVQRLKSPGIVLGEIKRILGDRSVLGFMVMAPMLYGIFYPQPYLGQTLRHIPIAVVDLDRTELSRQLIMTLDADAAVKVAVSAATLAEAQEQLFRRNVFGIIEIPAGTTRDFLKGDAARLPAYVDSAYFLVFSRSLQGIVESAATVTLGNATHDARAGGEGDRLIAAVNPATILPVPLFNPTGGYASYVVPAAFVLILQQTLLMGSAMLSGVAFESGGWTARRARGSGLAVIGQAIAHLIIYVPALLLFLVVLPRVYGFSTLGKPLDLFGFAATFILVTSLFGQAVGSWLRHRETVVVLFIATTLPQFFLVGLSWPVEAIPPIMRSFGRIFPSEAGIDGMVRINQMGARLGEVSSDWIALVWLGLAYYVIAVAGNMPRPAIPAFAK